MVAGADTSYPAPLQRDDRRRGRLDGEQRIPSLTEVRRQQHELAESGGRLTVGYQVVLLAELAELFEHEAHISVVTSFPGFATDIAAPSAAPLLALLHERTGEHAAPAGAPYFTDASALVPAFNDVATVIIGPGESEQCHKTNEYCLIDRIEEAEAIYRDLILRMCVEPLPGSGWELGS